MQWANMGGLHLSFLYIAKENDMHMLTPYYVPELKRDLLNDGFHKYEGNVIDRFSAFQYTCYPYL